MRQSLGISVVWGMIGVTFFGLIFTPVFYVACRWLASKMPRAPEKDPTIPTTHGLPPHTDEPAIATSRLGDA
jgi:hypothetical protein